ncbi:MAG: UDP-N-acetylmuramoyl-L-alanine--D-glutamate ligase, partial [Spirochaetota bacterium]|nr:UDP-N-acetylmuramoyl-L-alanine--D-glutamate ligase [Spirochaetota bacterium]
RPDATAYIRGSEVIYQDRAIVSLVDIPLRGQHNLENILAAVLICKQAGVRDSSIQEVIREFRGLPHRNETVDELGGVLFINDSKATTINSVAKSILSQDRGIILLMGGQDKGLDFAHLRQLIESRVKGLILFGEARDKIRAGLGQHSAILVGDLEEAFSEALKVAVEGDVVLLSPGCTSFDQYQSYEQRGLHFKELVTRYKKAYETS